MENHYTEAVLPLLKFAGRTTIRPETDGFSVMEKFLTYSSGRNNVRVHQTNDNFIKWFLRKDERFSGGDLYRYKLSKDSDGISILKDLGGAEKAEISLVEICILMEMQAVNFDKSLMINGFSNLFHVRDIEGILRTVEISRFNDGWYVNAYPIEDSCKWYAGRQVFSRNPIVNLSGEF